MKSNTLINQNGGYAIKVSPNQAITSTGKPVRKVGEKTWMDEEGNPFFDTDW